MSHAQLLERLLSGIPAEPSATPRAWWTSHRAATAGLVPFERAVIGGARADRLGWAFVSGYEAALDALVPDRDVSRSAALSVTEPTGVHPARITTRIDEEGRLFGEKTFVTLGAEVDDLFVLARRGTSSDGRADLVLAELAHDAPGIALTSLPLAPFVPEIPHASVQFSAARVSRVLLGDGWTKYVRPFRTVEDLYVHAGFLGFLIARGLSWNFPRPAIERAIATLGALRALSLESPSSPAVHVALAGSIEATRELTLSLDGDGVWVGAPSEDSARFERDRPLLSVAGGARVERLARAWERLSAPR